MTYKRIKPLDAAAVFGGVFTAVMYMAYLFKIIIWPEGALASFITLTVLVLAIVPLVFNSFFRQKLGKAYKPLKIIYAVLTCFYAVSCTALAVYLINFAKTQPALQSTDVMIVYGCKAEGDTPGKMLKGRLDKAYEVLSENKEIICVVSGGQGEDETRTEASVMAQYLEAKGIDKSRILQEDTSRNTKQNLDNSLNVLKQNNISYTRIVCVSTRFHLARISLMCKDRGVPCVCFASDTTTSSLISMITREYMSFVHYVILGW